MSEEVLRERVQRLVNNFWEQLRGVLEECSSSARRVPLVHRPRSDGTFATDDFDIRRRKYLPKEVCNQLHQLSGAVGRLSYTLNRPTDSFPRTQEEGGMEEPLFPEVVVCGPPGTEPKSGFSRTRWDSNESLVYSRSSTALTLEASPFQKFVIPSKDVPRKMCKVDIFVPKEQLIRCTRSTTSMFKSKTRRASSESESESSLEHTSDSDVTESEGEETVSRRRRRIERTRRRDRRKGKLRPPPLKLQQRSEPSSVTNSDSDETVLEHPLSRSTPAMGAARLTDRDNPILKTILRGNRGSTVKDTAPSPAVSEEYETAKEDLSGMVDTEDDKFYSFCNDYSPTHTSTSPGERSHPLHSSKKAQRRNGEISTSARKSLLESIDDSNEKSGIYTVLMEIAGCSELSLRGEGGDGEGSLFDNTAANSRRCARMRTGTHSRGYIKERRRSIPITSILRRQPVVKLTKVPLSEMQRERVKKRMECESNSGSSSNWNPPRSGVKQSATSSDEGGENNGEDISVAMEIGDGGGGIIDSLTDVDIHSDDHQESSRSEAKEILETPKSIKPITKRCLSLTLSKKCTPDNKFTTPKLNALSRTVQPVSSSAKRKLHLDNSFNQKGGNMSSSQFWSSDSDFDNMPLSQQKSTSSTLVKQSTRVEKSNTPIAAKATTPGLKRKKILSSFSSEDEEIIPSFLQKQKAEKAAEIKEREERNLVNGDAYCSGDDGGVKGNDDPPLDLKSTKKLGKYEKSPAGRGKEKARSKSSGLPSKINCAACNKNLYWQTKKIHSHPRLSVLVCIKCHQKFNQGTFKVEGDNEIYCTLCGDGGNLVLCSFCQHSFCQDCIQRLSGEKHLDYLLSSDDIDFKCYVCNPKDIEPLQKLCDDVCYYFSAHSQGKQNKEEYKSDKYVIDSDSSTARSRETSTDGQEGGNGGGVNGFSGGWSFGSENSQGRKEGESSKRRGRSGGKKAEEQQEQQQQEDTSSDKGSRSSALRGGGGGGETRNSSKSRRQQDSKRGKDRWHGAEKGSSQKKRGGRWGTAHTGDDSSSDSMSDVGESSEVNTDEISLSDSSLFEDVGVRKKDKKKASKCERRRRRRGSDEEEGRGTDKDKDQEPGKTAKKKKKRITVGHLHDSLLPDSDIESSDSVNVNQPSPPPKERRKRRKQHSSSESGLKPSRKRGRLGSTLSSGSGGSDNDQERLAITVSDSEMGGAKKGYDSSNSLFDDGMSKGGEGSQSVKYCTPLKLNARQVTDSSDSDVVPLKRTSKKEARSKALGSSSSSEKEAEGAEKKGRGYKTRSKKRKKHGSGSEEDFVSDDLSLRGPRLNNRHKRLKLTSFLSSDSSSSDENSSGNKRKRKGKENKKAESDKPTTPNTPGQKRKNIRKLIADEKLAQSTRIAQREEEERRERLKQKAKLLAPIEDSERVILEQDTTSKAVKIEVRDTLVRELKPHQVQGIKFLYDTCIESLERFKAGQTNGAILAHCMGLGKTLQVIAFVDALLNCEESGVKHVLVLSPVNAIHNWMAEFHRWIPLMECDYGIYILRETDTRLRLQKLRTWYKKGGVLMIGYEMYRNLAVAKKIRRKAFREELAKYLLDPGPNVMVCDEGHVMRNSKSSLSIVLGQVKTRTRIILTGTPLQNNLMEYYTMVNFVKPNLLGTQKEFTNRFMNPIKNGQCRDSSPYDIRKMKQRAHVLYMLLQGSVQRRDYRVLAEHLPPKQEYVLNIRLSPVQDQLYRRYLEKTRGVFLSSDLFSTYHSLSKVWNHPWVLKLDEDRQFERAERAAMYGLSDSEPEDDDDDDTLGGFIVDSDESSNASSIKTRAKIKGKNKRSGSSRSSSLTSSRSVTPAVGQAPPSTCIVISSDDSDDSSSKAKKDLEYKPEYLVKREAAIAAGESSGRIPRPPPREKTPPPWYEDLLSEESIDKIELSGKLLFLVELLKEAEKLKEKVLVFSQSLLTLDLIEEFLGKEENGDWTPALDYYRLDGSTRAEMRMSNMTEFNKLKNSRLRLFLISTRAGSLGVNLVGANRVVIFDACWNPSHDLQAIFRTYRYGQTRPIFVYRLLAQGTMEEKIYDRQVTKQSLSLRVVDEKQIGRHFTQSDLAELFSYSPAPLPDQSAAKPVKKPEEDMVLSSILEHMHPQWIISYHEHDSLLEHVFDEELSEAERKAAWENYKAEKQAETARYNVEALHTKLLREEELERAAAMAQQRQNPAINSTMVQLASQVAAARQAIHAMQQHKHLIQAAELQQQQHHHDSTTLVQNVVVNIDQTLHKIGELQNLHSEKRRLAAHYGGSGGTLPPEGKSQDEQLNEQLRHGYTQLSRSIQLANETIGCFNKSSAAQNSHLLQVVSMKRQQLSTQLAVLKGSQGKSMGGADPPTGSSVGVQYNHIATSGHGGGSTGAEVFSSSSTNPTIKERLIARVAGSNEEKQMRETAKELLVKKTKVPADSSTAARNR